MKKALIGVVVMGLVAAGAHAAVQAPDVYTNGGHVAQSLQRLQSGRLADEQFRRIAVRKADPFVDGARQIDVFTDGALARVGGGDPFTDGA